MAIIEAFTTQYNVYTCFSQYYYYVAYINRSSDTLETQIWIDKCYEIASTLHQNDR